MPIAIRPGRENLTRNDDRMEELFRRVQRLLAMTAEHPIEIQKNGDAIHFAWKDARPCWARITGPVVGEIYSGGENCPFSQSGGSGNFPGNHYAGVEITCRIGMSFPEDMESGLTFNSCRPLIELSGNTSVPENAIVYATPALAGTHYEFVYGTASASCSADPACQSGSDTPCCIRVSDFFQSREDGCGIRDGCICVTPTGLVFIPDDGT